MNSEAQGDIIFCGMKGESCEGFIRALRKAAFEVGRIHDDDWIAAFASTCLDGPALRFYEDLSPEVQGDWRLLRQALLTKYPLSERFNDNAGARFCSSCTFFPAPGAAPPPLQSRRGRIKVIGENSADLGYIGNGNTSISSSLGAGAPEDDASILSYTSSGKLHEMVVESSSGKPQVLGLHWISPSPNSAIGSTDFAAITAFNCEGSHRSSTMAWKGPGATAVWKIMPDGTVCPHLGEDNASTALRFFMHSNSGSKRFAVDVAADAGAFITNHGKNGWVLVKLLFLPLD